MKPLKKSTKLSSLPRSYDLRLVHGKYIAQPIDQGWCGSSWAITTAQVTTDRFAIMSKGTITDVLSPQHLLSCNSNNQQGCAGGHVTRAWVWVKKFGWVLVPSSWDYTWRERRDDIFMAFFFPKAHHGRLLPVDRPEDQLPGAQEKERGTRDLPGIGRVRFRGYGSTTPGQSRVQDRHGRGYHARYIDIGIRTRWSIMNINNNNMNDQICIWVFRVDELATARISTFDNIGLSINRSKRTADENILVEKIFNLGLNFTARS